MNDMSKEVKFFAEYVLLETHTKEEKNEALTYLRLWKKFNLLKIRNDFPNLKQIYEDQIVYRPALDPFKEGTLSLKFAMVPKNLNEIT